MIVSPNATHCGPEGRDRKTDHTRTHHILCYNDERPHGKGTLFPEAVEEDLSHGLSKATIHDALEVLAHAERESHVDRYPRN
jgi:hypothetical protein